MARRPLNPDDHNALLEMLTSIEVMITSLAHCKAHLQAVKAYPLDATMETLDFFTSEFERLEMPDAAELLKSQVLRSLRDILQAQGMAVPAQFYALKPDKVGEWPDASRVGQYGLRILLGDRWLEVRKGWSVEEIIEMGYKVPGILRSGDTE